MRQGVSETHHRKHAELSAVWRNRDVDAVRARCVNRMASMIRRRQLRSSFAAALLAGTSHSRECHEKLCRVVTMKIRSLQRAALGRWKGMLLQIAWRASTELQERIEKMQKEVVEIKASKAALSATMRTSLSWPPQGNSNISARPCRWTSTRIERTSPNCSHNSSRRRRCGATLPSTRFLHFPLRLQS